jgi:hypothetical protein
MARGLILQPARRPDSYRVVSGREVYDLYRGAVAAFREWLEGCPLKIFTRFLHTLGAPDGASAGRAISH